MSRSPISSHVGDIPVVNSYYSGNLKTMSISALESRLRVLRAADPEDEDEDEAFENRMVEIDAIRAELVSRQKS